LTSQIGLVSIVDTAGAGPRGGTPAPPNGVRLSSELERCEPVSPCALLTSAERGPCQAQLWGLVRPNSSGSAPGRPPPQRQQRGASRQWPGPLRQSTASPARAAKRSAIAQDAV